MPSTTEAPTYRNAFAGSPASRSRNAWTEKVEKVVNPPSRPTPIALRLLSESHSCGTTTSAPRRNDPTTLIATVAQGSASPWNAFEMPYRVRPPTTLAIATPIAVAMQLLSIGTGAISQNGGSRRAPSPRAPSAAGQSTAAADQFPGSMLGRPRAG